MHEKNSAKQQNRKTVTRVPHESTKLTACLGDVGSTLKKADIACLTPHKKEVLRTMIIAWQSEFDRVDLDTVSRAVDLLNREQL